jgi:hypothetical protein
VLDAELDAGWLPDLDAMRRRFTLHEPAMPQVTVELADLAAYGSNIVSAVRHSSSPAVTGPLHKHLIRRKIKGKLAAAAIRPIPDASTKRCGTPVPERLNTSKSGLDFPPVGKSE